MARIDKYDPFDGGFRAPLLAAITVASGNLEKILPVSLDTNGKVVVAGAGQTGIVGVLVVTEAKNAGDIVDVMTDGELVECTGLVAGQRYWSSSAGVVNTTNTGTFIGFTVEATRMIVRVGRAGPAVVST